jgi:hypothetical protein
VQIRKFAPGPKILFTAGAFCQKCDHFYDFKVKALIGLVIFRVLDLINVCRVLEIGLHFLQNAISSKKVKNTFFENAYTFSKQKITCFKNAKFKCTITFVWMIGITIMLIHFYLNAKELSLIV